MLNKPLHSLPSLQSFYPELPLLFAEKLHLREGGVVADRPHMACCFTTRFVVAMKKEVCVDLQACTE